MIFVTVGSMFPFDRLVRAVDAFAAARPREVFMAQIGRSSFRPNHMQSAPILSAPDFRRAIAEAKLIVAHAGMGSVIMALAAAKPIVVLPRRSELGEVTTNHQLATAKWLAEKRGVLVVLEESDLFGAMDSMLAAGGEVDALQPWARPELIANIRRFIEPASEH